MNRHALSALGLTIGLLSTWTGLAVAQTSELTTPVQATFRGAAPAGCRISAPAAPVSENVQIGSLSAGSAAIAINQMVDESSAPLGATVVLVMPAICNQAHTLHLSSLNGGLLGDGPAAGVGGFRSVLPYSVTVAWAGGEQLLLTSDQNLSVVFGEAAAGEVTVTIQIPQGGAPLVAGAYTDEIVLELGAAG